MEQTDLSAKVASNDQLGAWLPIATAPRDGTTFIAARFVEDEEPEYEIGNYEPTTWAKYEPAEGGLFRQVLYVINEWRGFNNFHRMTHWAHLPAAPQRA